MRKKPVTRGSRVWPVLLLVAGLLLGALVTRLVDSPVVFRFEVVVPDLPEAVPHGSHAAASYCVYGDWRKQIYCIT